MKNKVIKQKLIFLAETTHRRIFKEEMSDTMREFLGNLSWSFFGGITAGGIMFVVQIIVARIIGVNQFGKYNIVLSFATSLSFLFLFGSDVGGIRFLADKKNKKNRKNIFSTLLAIIFFQIAIVLFFLLLFKESIIKYFNIAQALYFVGIFLGVIMAIRSIFDGYIRSLMLFKKQSVAKFIEVSIVIGLFGFFIYLSPHKFNYRNYINIIIWSYVVFIIILMFFLRHQFGKIQLASIKKILAYNKFVVLISIGGFLMSLEKMLIGKFIGIKELGIFSAYYLASSLILANFGGIFFNVFLPSVISAKENISVIVEKMNNLLKKIFVVWLIVDVLIVYIVFKFIGNDYQFNVLLALMFVVSSYLAFIFSFLADILKIDYIKIVLPIVIISNLLMITIIIFGGSIYLYVLIQIFIYFFACYFMRKYIIIKYDKNTRTVIK